jgi:O-antigen/teichoic acid export membrane protein
MWNLLGQALPAVAAFIAIPPLVRGLGTDRFGVLTLAWTLIGYFSLFDFGLGRALTKFVAENVGRGDDRQISAIVWTATSVMTVLGTIAGVALGLSSSWLIGRVLHIPPHLRPETLRAFYVLGFALPIVTAHAGLRGVLEALMRFDLTNAVRIPMGILTFLGPLCVLPFSRSLFAVVSVLAAVRAAGCVAQLIFVVRTLPPTRREDRPKLGAVWPLVRFGGWMSISNVISPVMVSFDRFLISAMISVTAVTYYATPYEAVTKLLLIPGALVGVLFPAFSGSFVRDSAETSRLFRRGVKVLLLALFPLCLVTIGFAREALTIWLGSDFATRSGLVLQVLTVGVFVNGVASVPFALVQGIGRPDVTAKLHLLEFPVYLLLLWLLVMSHGIAGAAIAWATRMALDASLLLIISERSLKTPGVASGRLILGLTLCLLALTSVADDLSLVPKALLIALALLGFLQIARSRVVAGDDRMLFSDGLRLLGVRGG